MKKKFNQFVCLTITMLAFVSCSSDDDPANTASVKVISAQVEKGNSYNSMIDSVYVELDWENREDWGSEIIARSAYRNGGFTLALPGEIDDSFLYPINEEDEADEMFQNATISDKSARLAAFMGVSAYKEGSLVGSFERSNVDPFAAEDMEASEILSLLSRGIYSIIYMYADRPVTVKGSYTEQDSELEDGFFGEVKGNVNVSLLKGWNVVAIKMVVNMNIAQQKVTTTVTMTTSEPSGLKWYFYNYSDNFELALPPSALRSSSKLTQTFGTKFFHRFKFHNP